MPPSHRVSDDVVMPFLKVGDEVGCMIAPDLFHLPDKEEQREQGITRGDILYWLEEAQKICNVCPFQADCLEYALERPWLEGTWGGMSRWQRRQVRQNRQKAGIPTRSVKPPYWAPNVGSGDWVETERRRQRDEATTRIWERDYKQERPYPQKKDG